jgi:hypothetical protein
LLEFFDEHEPDTEQHHRVPEPLIDDHEVEPNEPHELASLGGGSRDHDAAVRSEVALARLRGAHAIVHDEHGRKFHSASHRSARDRSCSRSQISAAAVNSEV